MIDLTIPKSKFNLNDEDTVKDLCVESWNEIAEYGYISKLESKIVEAFDTYCFACDYYPTDVDDFDCGVCPLAVDANYDPETESACDVPNSLYTFWITSFASSTEFKKAVAIQIADTFIE